MTVFLRLDIDPSHVIGLFGTLLPPDFQVNFSPASLTSKYCLKEKLSYPDSPPQLQGREQENGLLSLIEYLTQVFDQLTFAYSTDLK